MAYRQIRDLIHRGDLVTAEKLLTRNADTLTTAEAQQLRRALDAQQQKKAHSAAAQKPPNPLVKFFRRRPVLAWGLVLAGYLPAGFSFALRLARRLMMQWKVTPVQGLSVTFVAGFCGLFAAFFVPGAVLLTGQLVRALRFWTRESCPVQVAEVTGETITNRYGPRERVLATVRPLSGGETLPETVTVEVAPVFGAPGLPGGEGPLSPREVKAGVDLYLCLTPDGKRRLTRCSRRGLLLLWGKDLLILAIFVAILLYGGATYHGARWILG